MKSYAVIILLILASFNLFSQNRNTLGLSFIKNYDRDVFQGNGKIWGISQNNEGIMYFTTSTGLWEYDGTRWNQYNNGLGGNVKSIYFHTDERLYTGGYGGFGYWAPDINGYLKYHWMHKFTPNSYSEVDEFWRIGESEGKVLFQSFKHIFLFEPITNRIDSIKAPSEFSFMFFSKGRAFVEDINKGLFEITKGTLVPVIETSEFGGTIVGVVAMENDNMLIVTSDEGIYRWENGSLDRTNWSINNGLRRDQVYSFQELGDGKMLFGTIMNGLYITSGEGELLLHMDTRKGLQENTILSTYLDIDNNLWLGLDGGVDYLKVNSSTTYLLDDIVKIGTIYAALKVDSLLYIGSNQGLYVLEMEGQNARGARPRLIPGTQGQVWCLSLIDGKIWIGHHNGTLMLDGDELRTLSNDKGVWIFKSHPEKADIVYAGNYTGINMYKKRNGLWVFEKSLEGFNESSRFIEFDKLGQIWIAHPTKGYFRIRLSDNGQSLIEKEFYGFARENVAPYAYMCIIDGDLVFFNANGFFQFDHLENKFSVAKYATAIFNGIEGIKYVKQYRDLFWYFGDQSLGYLYRNGTLIQNIQEPFAHIREKHLGDFGEVTQIDENSYAIGIYDGVVFCNAPVSEKQLIPESPIIRDVIFISSKDSIRAPLIPSGNFRIPYNYNYFNFFIATPRAPEGNFWKVQYKLSGLHEEWSGWTESNQLNFPGLAPGNYLLSLRVRDGNGNQSEVIEYPFYVRLPWFFNGYSITFYIGVLLFIFLLIRRYFLTKSRKEQQKIKEKEEEEKLRQKEQYEKKNLEAEKRVLLLKEEKLRLDIEKKNNELASSTMSNIRKNELLTELKLDLQQIQKNANDSFSISVSKKVLRKINNQINSKEDWLTFELHFNNAHENFFDKLRAEHPSLTSNDYKLCAYLKLNLSSKEIAALMNISDKSVEMSRYRLRKKLGLGKDESLVTYITAF